jgi:fatty-acyl-CoA synthase
LSEEVEAVAQGPSGLGLERGERGERVGVWATNCAAWVCLQLACGRAGMVLVNINPAYRAHELRDVLRRSGIKALFLRARDSRSDYRGILDEAAAGVPMELRHTVYLGEESWDRFLADGGNAGAVPTDCEEIANIQYTSGTTGAPKGVLLTHRFTVNDARVIARGLRITEADRMCVPVPLYHCFGCICGTLVAVVSGAAMILPSASFDALATMQAIHQERTTTTYGVPTMYLAQLQHPEFPLFDFTSLRTGIIGGTPVPLETMMRVVNEMHCPGLTITFGQTESSPMVTISMPDVPLETRLTTIGVAAEATEVMIAGAQGEPAPEGVPGELCIRGYSVMKGYDDDPAATAKAIDAEGWLHTGDLAAMRPDGFIRITGRLRDMIIRGGENVFPREIEDFLYLNPKIAEVQVIGVPDERLGECVAAWIRLHPGEASTEDEIREFCRGKIAHFKVPQYVRFVESFPLTVTGKVQKFAMRKREIEERGLQKADDTPGALSGKEPARPVAFPS